MNCDICGQEVANSEELKAHKEREHPIGDEQPEEEMPKPMEAPGMPVEESEPAERRNR